MHGPAIVVGNRRHVFVFAGGSRSELHDTQLAAKATIERFQAVVVYPNEDVLDPSATCVICWVEPTKKTEKILSAIARGLPVLTASYITACETSNQLVDVMSHELAVTYPQNTVAVAARYPTKIPSQYCLTIYISSINFCLFVVFLGIHTKRLWLEDVRRSQTSRLSSLERLKIPQQVMYFLSFLHHYPPLPPAVSISNCYP